LAYCIGRRSLHSLASLAGLIVLVFFLARLTGDPTNLYLPLDASLEARAEFAEKHGFNDPLIGQFGRFLEGLARLDLGESVRKARPAIEVVLEAFPTTFRLAAITMSAAVALAVLVGSLAAYRPGGAFDRAASVISLAGASAPDSGSRSPRSCCSQSRSAGCRPRVPARPGTGSCRSRCS